MAGEGDFRQRILDTTRGLLVAEGYARLSMRKIARELGFSATTLYLYFESKDDLFNALIDDGMARLYVALKEAAARHPADPEQSLRALCRCYVDFGLKHAEHYEVMFVLPPDRSSRLRPDVYRRARRNLELIESVLEEGRAAGVFSVTRCQLTACAIWAQLHGSVSLILGRRLDSGIDVEAFIEATIEQVFRTLTLSEHSTIAPS